MIIIKFENKKKCNLIKDYYIRIRHFDNNLKYIFCFTCIYDKKINKNLFIQITVNMFCFQEIFKNTLA